MLRNVRALPAAILVAVVLIVAVAGGATAAKLITGAQIKNGTVTTQDVRNDTLTTQDVRNQSLTGGDVKDGSVSGVDLANGSVRGADLAADARNQAKVAVGTNTFVPSCAGQQLVECEPLVDMPLTAGTWLVSATLTVNNIHGQPTSDDNRCGLLELDALLGYASHALGPNNTPNEGETLAFTQVVTATQPTGVTVRCTEQPGEALRAISATVSAVKVS
ncbi:hypothetical protein [Nocardioides lijunqiniae]|uniref:hypothetical protein n=1 Tax=Nocardioides lijunqiniae TaxID=2760832 RepID=UPI0018786496|nr:hypothetical protein [Nocardioides lijunqiniae]